jgi:hypothetical protein
MTDTEHEQLVRDLLALLGLEPSEMSLNQIRKYVYISPPHIQLPEGNKAFAVMVQISGTFMPQS